MIAPGTPLPWSFVPWHIEEGPPAVRAPDGYLVTSAASDSDAAYIVHACNLYPELLEALQNLLAVNEGEGGTRYHAQDIARAALAKAGAA